MKLSLLAATIFIALMNAGTAQAATFHFSDKDAPDGGKNDTFTGFSFDFGDKDKGKSHDGDKDRDDFRGDFGKYLANCDKDHKGDKDDIFHHLHDGRDGHDPKGNCDPPSPTPLPGSVSLFGAGLMALAAFAFVRRPRLRRRQTS